MPQQVRLHRQSQTVGCSFPFQVAEAGDQERKEPTRESGKSVRQKQRSVSQRTAGPTLLSDSELTEPVALKNIQTQPNLRGRRRSLSLQVRPDSRRASGPGTRDQQRPQRPRCTRLAHRTSSGAPPDEGPAHHNAGSSPRPQVPQNEVQRKLLFQARESAGRHNTCAVTVTPPSSQTDPAG